MAAYTKFDLNNYPSPLITSPDDDYFSYNTIATRKPKIVTQVLAETFFFRRLLEAVEYFDQGEWAGIDPFLPRKQEELDHDIPWQVLDMALDYAVTNSGDSFCALLRHCIWSNRVDLSHPQIVEEMRQQATQQKALGDLLVDDTEPVLAVLQKVDPASARLDFLCDNTGTELLLDLALVDFFLRHKWAKQVTLHVKYHPTFVSDAIPVDIDLTLDAMQQRSGRENAGKRL